MADPSDPDCDFERQRTILKIAVARARLHRLRRTPATLVGGNDDLQFYTCEELVRILKRLEHMVHNLESDPY